MRRTPSVKSLRHVFGDKAAQAKRVLKMTRAELEQTEAGYARVKECYHAPSTGDIRLTVLDALGETFGVEYARSSHGTATYLNTGDTYAPTLIRWQGKYRVQSLGDLVETQERRGVRFD